MRKLHLVGFTADMEGLIFSARKGSKTGSFVVPLGDELVDTIAEAQRLRNGDEPAQARAGNSVPERRRLRAESALTPREIQARIRAGHSLEDVAGEAGVDMEWVERFAVPILAEQLRVVEQARAVTYSKPRRGESALPLGPSVAQNVSMRGVLMPPDVFDAAWSAHHVYGGVWIVRFRYRSRGRPHEAAWELDLPANHLMAANRLGSELGHVDATRRRGAPTDAADSRSDDGDVPPRKRAQRPAGARSKKAAGARPVKSASRSRPAGSRAPAAGARRSTGRGRAGTASRSSSPSRTPAASKGRTRSRAPAASRSGAQRASGTAATASSPRRRATSSTPPARRARQPATPATSRQGDRQVGRAPASKSSASSRTQVEASASPARAGTTVKPTAPAPPRNPAPDPAPAPAEPVRRLGGAIALGGSATTAVARATIPTDTAPGVGDTGTSFRARIAAQTAAQVASIAPALARRWREGGAGDGAAVAPVPAPA